MKYNDKETYRLIGEILWKYWDPIGLSTHENISDEYGQYVPILFRLKMEKVSVIEIASVLEKIQTIDIGLECDIKYCEEIAEKILKI